MAEMERVRGGEQIAGVAELARETWRRHYTPIIGAAQVAYMLETFQSAAAVARQISEGYEYYLIVEAGTRAGYFALLSDAAGPRLLLSKIYILAEQQGRGLGKSVVDFAERRCRELGRDVLWLTVNKHNDRTIAFYERVGFVRESSVVTDIGGGFVMDDYVMAKRVGDGGA
jgi:ribosomal protein S18 acetylase RimI-like enzyme